MGMDVYGLNPQRNTAKPEILIDYSDNEGWADWDKLKEANKTEEYHEARDSWDDENPGRYFRNNVWWWRPLWDYVCFVCDDILNEEDQEGGHSNSGHQINEKKAEVIASRLKIYIENGDVHHYERERQKALDDMPDEECSICEGTGKRQEPPVTGAGDVECNGCQSKGSRRPFNTQYPFDVDNVREFIKFCEQSGGFQIC